MGLLRQFFRIFDLQVALIAALAVAATWGCIAYGIRSDLPSSLIAVAIVFPIVFSIGAAYQRRETDLVISVTPRLVKPARPGDKLATPLDGRVAANDVEFFIKGQQEIKVDRPPRLTGHILDLYPEDAVGDMKNGSYK